MCRKKPKPRQFHLFNDILVYGNIVISKKKYNKQHIMQLENIKLVSIPDEGSFHNGWQIISPSKSFTVYAATAQEKTEWMAHIAKCARDILAKQGRKSLQAEASPVWVPDSDTTTCMHCRKSEFSIINRRHHCRKCGIVCCNACASKRLVLHHQSTKPLRVCLTCYNKANISSTSGAPPSVNYSNESSGEDSSDSDDEVTGTSNGTCSETPTFYEGVRP